LRQESCILCELDLLHIHQMTLLDHVVRNLLARATSLLTMAIRHLGCNQSLQLRNHLSALDEIQGLELAR